ncbi:hypothetical protein GCM10022207_93160 [Streptomyces lannensis]|uniref:Nitroreductase domain-containing protein n=1 Tax=Streptomyces lannensis TaxID=766498 RepID=A0ABP7M0B6_9ACTN
MLGIGRRPHARALVALPVSGWGVINRDTGSPTAGDDHVSTAVANALALSLIQLGIARPMCEALSPPGAELGAARLGRGQPTGGTFLEPGWGRKDSEAP